MCLPLNSSTFRRDFFFLETEIEIEEVERIYRQAFEIDSKHDEDETTIES